jgi:hypothetical protein
MQAHVYHLIDDHLDTTKCYSGQALASLEVVRSAVRAFFSSHIILTYAIQAANKFPDIDNYCGRWPVTDLIKLHLKNTSSKHRKLAVRVTAGNSEERNAKMKSKRRHIKLKA